MSFMKLTITIICTFALITITSCGSPSETENGFVPEKPELTSSTDNIYDVADVIRDTNPHFNDLLNDPALTAVTREFGNSVISDSNLPIRSEVAISHIKPWSSWWYPKKDDYLFNDVNGKNSSALSKYDHVRKKRYEDNKVGPAPNSAAEYEKKYYYPNSVSWEGLCDAWSIASISKPEPKRPVTIKLRGSDVTFSVGELKALLLKTYEATDDSALKYFGQKFTGSYNSWIQPDIFPEQFHRFVEVQLMTKKLPFIMDHDPGIEVWNNPVFKANYLIEKIPGQPDAVFVRMWIYTAEASLITEKDFVGTKEAVREYNYVLTGTRNATGDLEIKSGYWVKGPDGVDSRKDHPDYLMILSNSGSLVRKSWNPEIDIALVDEILSASY